MSLLSARVAGGQMARRTHEKLVGDVVEGSF